MTRLCSMVVVLLLFATPVLAGQPKGDYKELYRRGVEFNKQGKLKEAIGYYTKALALKSDSAELYFVRGRAYLQSDQMQESADDLSRAVKLKPGYAEAYNQRGVTYIGLGKQQEALVDFNKACGLGHQDGCRNAKKFKELNGR
ncbi:MAG: tetratricopeptide repeat protein [Geobacter sp.]|nr:tetratricopeptide repeat protein [Geobacter sp.]